MTIRVHWSDAACNIVVANNMAELADYGDMLDDPDEITFPVLLIEDTGNCETWAVQGSIKQIGALGLRIADQALLAAEGAS